MSDDIVTKLEFLLQEGAEIIKEQAAEIERLRAEVDKWKWHSSDLFRALLVQRCMTFHTATAQGAEERYKKAVCDGVIK